MKEELYYLVKVTDYIAAETTGNSSEEAHEAIVELVYKSKVIDLQDEAIEEKARKFYWKRNPNKIIAENTRPDMVIGYFQALTDLKQKL